MLSDRKGWILRLIAQAAAMARRLRAQLAGGADAGEVARAAGAAIGELLGDRAELVAMLDPASAALLVGDPDRVDAWAELLRVQGDAHAALGDAGTAEALHGRAAALAAEAERRRAR